MIHSTMNINDTIRNLCHGFKSTDLKNKFKEIVSTIVVMGEESCGKTSTLMRISGITLPTARKTCTRVAHVIQMRQGDSPQIRITLLDHKRNVVHSKGVFQGPHYDLDDICKTIRATQDALDLGSVGFSEDYEIQIEKDGHDFNLTLVDLPGLVDVSDTGDTHETYRIYEKHTQRKATIVFHIVEAGRNINTTQGNKFIVQNTKGKDSVTVFTKIDKLTNDEANGHFRDALTMQSEHKHVCLLENSQSETCDHESKTSKTSSEADFIRSKLSELQIDDENMLIGATDLSKLLQQLLENKIREYQRDIKELMHREKEVLSDRLTTGDLRKFNSYQEWQHILQKIEDTYEKTCKKQYEEQMRGYLESIRKEIKEAKDISGTSDDRGQRIEDFSDFEPGDEVFVSENDEDFERTLVERVEEDDEGNHTIHFELDFQNQSSDMMKHVYRAVAYDNVELGSTLWTKDSNQFKEVGVTHTGRIYRASSYHDEIKYTIKQTGTENTISRGWYNGSDKLYQRHTVPKYKFYYVETRSMTDKIRKVVDSERRFQNRAHCAAFPVVCHFAKKFSDTYMSICERYRNKMTADRKTLVETVLTPARSLPEIYDDVKHIMTRVFDNIDRRLDERLYCLSQENSDPDQIHSTNEHYLTSKFKARIESIKSLAHDDAYLQIFQVHVEAYMDDQCKYVQQHIDRLFVSSFSTPIERLFSRYLIRGYDKDDQYQRQLYKPLDSLHELQEKLKEPVKLEKERDNAQKDLKILKRMALELDEDE